MTWRYFLLVFPDFFQFPSSISKLRLHHFFIFFVHFLTATGYCVSHPCVFFFLFLWNTLLCPCPRSPAAYRCCLHLTGTKPLPPLSLTWYCHLHPVKQTANVGSFPLTQVWVQFPWVCHFLSILPGFFHCILYPTPQDRFFCIASDCPRTICRLGCPRTETSACSASHADIEGKCHNHLASFIES